MMLKTRFTSELQNHEKTDRLQDIDFRYIQPGKAPALSKRFHIFQLLFGLFHSSFRKDIHYGLISIVAFGLFANILDFVTLLM